MAFYQPTYGRSTRDINIENAIVERQRRNAQNLTDPGSPIALGNPGMDAFFGGIDRARSDAYDRGENFHLPYAALGLMGSGGGGRPLAQRPDANGEDTGIDPVTAYQLQRAVLNRTLNDNQASSVAQTAAMNDRIGQQTDQGELDNALAPGRPIQRSVGADGAPSYATGPAPAPPSREQILASVPGHLRPGLEDMLDKMAANKQAIAASQANIVKGEEATKLARDTFNATLGPGAAQTVDAGPPDPLTANKVDPRTGLTGNALHQNGIAYALQGVMPSMGMGGKGPVNAARMAIQNKAGALAAAVGADLPTLRAEYKANSAALSKILPQYTTLSAYADGANRNIQLAVDQSAKVPRTGSPMVNRFMQWANGHELSGNPELTRFETYIYSAAREYAKVTSGSFMSAAELSQAAAKKADELINAAQTPDAFKAATEAMQQDMNNVTGPWLNQIQRVNGTIAAFLATAHGQSMPVAAPGPAAPGAGGGGRAGGPGAGPRADPLGIRKP